MAHLSQEVEEMWLNVLSSVVEQTLWRLWQIVARFREEDAGASMVEYAIIVALIAIVAIAAVQSLGNGITQVFQNILGHIQGLGR